MAQNSQVNLMDANNLSVVFGPNLTWPTNQQVYVLTFYFFFGCKFYFFCLNNLGIFLLIVNRL